MLQLISIKKACAYDPLLADTYLFRMAAASHHYGIYAAEDILDFQGVLLVRQGTPISPDVAEALVGQQLFSPLDEVIGFTEVMSVDQLEFDFCKLMQNDTFLSSLNEHQNLIALINVHVKHCAPFQRLMQLISVMSIAMPDLYQRTLYCTWLSLIIAKEMHFSERGCAEVFLAALAHDIGMLHLHPYVLNSKAALSLEEWSHIQSHVDIGKYLLQKIPGIPGEVIAAVYEHHERCDGTGYPCGKVEGELSYAGKIVGLADSMVAIYHNYFKPHHRSWGEIIPAIQMNATEYFYRHEEVLVKIWRRSEMPITNVIQDDELPQFVAELLQTNDRLRVWFEVLRDALLQIGFIHGDRHLHSVQNIVFHLNTSIKGSGIFDPKELEWLRNLDVHPDKEASCRIEKAHIQHHEIVFHLQRLTLMLEQYLESSDADEIAGLLRSALLKVKTFML